MARFDVDSSATTYHPTRIEWIQPERIRRQDGSSVRSIYWTALLVFESSGGEHLPAAFEAWEAYDDGATHTIVIPPPNDVSGSDDTFTAYIEVETWPDFRSVNVSNFTIAVRPAEFTP